MILGTVSIYNGDYGFVKPMHVFVNECITDNGYYNLKFTRPSFYFRGAGQKLKNGDYVFITDYSKDNRGYKAKHLLHELNAEKGFDNIFNKLKLDDRLTLINYLSCSTIKSHFNQEITSIIDKYYREVNTEDDFQSAFWKLNSDEVLGPCFRKYPISQYLNTVYYNHLRSILNKELRFKLWLKGKTEFIDLSYLFTNYDNISRQDYEKSISFSPQLTKDVGDRIKKDILSDFPSIHESNQWYLEGFLTSYLFKNLTFQSEIKNGLLKKRTDNKVLINLFDKDLITFEEFKQANINNLAVNDIQGVSYKALLKGKLSINLFLEEVEFKEQDFIKAFSESSYKAFDICCHQFFLDSEFPWTKGILKEFIATYYRRNHLAYLTERLLKNSYFRNLLTEDFLDEVSSYGLGFTNFIIAFSYYKRPELLSRYTQFWDWKLVTQYYVDYHNENKIPVSYDFVEEFKAYLDWTILSGCFFLPWEQKFINNYGDRIDWAKVFMIYQHNGYSHLYRVSIFRNNLDLFLNVELLKKFSDKIMWHEIANQSVFLSNKQVLSQLHRYLKNVSLNWCEIFANNKDLASDLDIINLYEDTIDCVELLRLNTRGFADRYVRHIFSKQSSRLKNWEITVSEQRAYYKWECISALNIEWDTELIDFLDSNGLIKWQPEYWNTYRTVRFKPGASFSDTESDEEVINNYKASIFGNKCIVWNSEMISKYRSKLTKENLKELESCHPYFLLPKEFRL